ncbi:MAG: response regulator [Anaerolineales bacterium]|nr:response regulator [Anaerolineales bacterium]
MINQRILVVDDEKGVVHSCVRILERQGFTVSGLTDSQAAPALLQQESFDLLLTDIKMPRLDGLELLRLAKEIDPHLTVVLITGYGTMEDAINAIQLGAQGFLMKPFEPKELVATIKDNLARRELLRDSLRLQTLLPLLEINQILQVAGSEASLVHRVLEIVQRETGAARLAWLSRPYPAFSAFAPPRRGSIAPGAGSRSKFDMIEMAVVCQNGLQCSGLAQSALEAAVSEGEPVWILGNGATVKTLEGQSNIVGALLPLIINGEIVGLLTAETGSSGRNAPFNQISLDLLSVLAGQLAILLENVQLFQQTEALRTFNEDIIQNMSNGLIAVDQEGYITAFNPAASQMLGYRQDEALHQLLTQIIQPSAELIKIFNETMTTGKSYTHQEITLQHREGQSLSVSASTAPLGGIDRAGRPIGVVGVLEDLSEIKTMEAERRRLDRLAALGEMSAVVAHEIRNPIAGIAAGIDYLTRNVAKDSPEFEGAVMMRGEIQRVNRILEDILFVARPARLKLSNEDVAEIIEDVLQRFRGQVEESRVTITLDYANNLPRLSVDRQRLEQLFTNLIINATQAMPNGGQLSLQTRVAPSQNGKPADEVIVTIADTGPGIPVETQQHIFEPFFTTKTRGTGLGLTIARRIVEEHGGTISIESEAEHGTRFIIRLPVARRATV